jgi:hypothetical protein
MVGFKDFENAAVTIAGIELLHRIRKEPVRTGTSRRSRPSRVYYLERGADCLKRARRSSECLRLPAIGSRADLRSLAMPSDCYE